MSKHRTLQSAGWVNPSAVKACRWCEGPIPKPRRTFCSDACVHEHRVRSDPGYARAQVFKRDLGVCSSCGLDTSRLKRLIDRYRWRFEGGRRGRRVENQRGRILRLLGLDPNSAGDRATYWDMDHEKPVVEGGGECGLDNLRTLCLWCHKRETKRLARRRARERSGQAALFGEDVLDHDLDPG